MAKPQFPDEQSPEGEFERQEDAFRDWVSADGSTPYPAVAGRYHLYVCLACPWASRTVIARHLKGLDAVIGMTVIDPIRDERGWAFRDGPGYSTDPINDFDYLSEAYVASDPGFKGRATVPVLWDKKKRRIVNNSEDDICRMFNGAFDSLGLLPAPNTYKSADDFANNDLTPRTYDWTKPIVLFDNNPDGGSEYPLIDDIRKDQIWLIRRGKGVNSGDTLGIFEPQDVQPLSKEQ